MRFGNPVTEMIPHESQEDYAGSRSPQKKRIGVMRGDVGACLGKRFGVRRGRRAGQRIGVRYGDVSGETYRREAWGAFGV
jgi:hypothetical protein